MAPKKETPDAPKTKRTMTPEQLEKLAQARAKANEVRQAMKEGREDAQVAALQAKMNVIKAKKKQKEPTVPEEPPETDPEKEDKVAKPVPEPVPEPAPEPAEPKTEAGPTQAGIPVEKLKKKTKKKVIVMPSSDTSDSDDDSNVIFVKRSSRKKKPESVPPPVVSRQPSPIKTYTCRPPSNPFFNPMFSYGSRNFQ